MSLFEVHLITAPTVSIEELTALLPLLPEKATRPRVQVARTHYGQHPVQPMLTYWLHGEEAEVRASVDATVKNLSVDVKRVKIEGLQSGVADDHALADMDRYWEFHAKIPAGAGDGEAWSEAAIICANSGAHLFWNGVKPGGPLPIIALRRYCCTKASAARDWQQLTSNLAAASLPVTEVHAELGILDTNPRLDAGWLFAAEGKQDDFLRCVPVH